MVIFMSHFMGTSQCKCIDLAIGVPSTMNCAINGTEHAGLNLKKAFFSIVVGDDCTNELLN